MSSTVEVKCQRCKELFTARVADRKRGWGKFCCKSCKAIKQVHSGQYRPQLSDWDRQNDEHESALYNSTTSWEEWR